MVKKIIFLFLFSFVSAGAFSMDTSCPIMEKYYDLFEENFSGVSGVEDWANRCLQLVSIFDLVGNLEMVDRLWFAYDYVGKVQDCISFENMINQGYLQRCPDISICDSVFPAQTCMNMYFLNKFWKARLA
jgi:hypothetical protein